MEIDITKLSSKGQIVIPVEMRKGFTAGEKLIIFRDKDRLILKKVSDMDEQMKEDLEFARRTEKAWKSYERGEFKSMDFDDFIKKMKKW